MSTLTIEQKDALRKGSSARNRLSTSRPAKARGQRSAQAYNGQGNIPRYIMAACPELKKNKRGLEYALKVAMRYAEKENDGRLPDRVMLRRLLYLVN